MATDLHTLDSILQNELGKRDLDQVKTIRQNPDGSLDATANKLLPVLTDKQEPVYVPVPVTLLIKLDQNNAITHLEGDTPSPEVVKDATAFVKSLVDNQQLGGWSDTSVLHPSHQIELNPVGKKVIRRKHF